MRYLLNVLSVMMRTLSAIWRFITILFIVIITGFLIIWLTSILKCEFLTWRYGSQFANEYLQTGWIDSIDYLKVLEYDKEYSKVYYVVKDDSSYLVTFKADSELQWSVKTWYCVWAKYGNADEIIWPYGR